MDPRHLEYYERELDFVREMGKEFAQRYPKIAATLDLGSTECADPYVERLLESFAFLSARIHLKMDAEFPRFTQHLLEIVYPHYLAPLPSMTVLQVHADLKGGVTEEGFVMPRHTRLFSHANIKGRSKCEFQTAHEIKLWPIELVEASYLPLGEALRYAETEVKAVKSGLRLKLKTALELTWQELNIETLSFYLHGSGRIPAQLYEMIVGHGLAIVVQHAGGRTVLRKEAIQAQGFDEQQALLPHTAATFQGYRLLQEYFSLPERFLFIDIAQLKAPLQQCAQTEIEIIILLKSENPSFEDLIDKSHFALNCTPAINLFNKRTDRIHLNNRSTEHHVIIDRTKPKDFEIFSIQEVEGFGVGAKVEQIFRPFYSQQQDVGYQQDFAYYSISRQASLASSSASLGKVKSDYIDTEVYISLVDANEAPYDTDLKQIGLYALCTNRDLPRMVLLGEGNTDFNWDMSAPIESIRCLTVLTDPKPSHATGSMAWRLINHLSLNYLSLINNDEQQGASALRDLLKLYADYAEPAVAQQIEGLIAIQSKATTVRVPIPGPMCFGRGVEISLQFDESAFVGSSSFLLSAVLERFFCKYVSINSFTQVVASTRERGEIMRWPVRTGTRATL